MTTITLEDVARMPEDGFRHEIDAGELIAEPPSLPLHGTIRANVITLLGGYVLRNQLGSAVSGSGFILGRNPDTLRGPDFAFFRADRLHLVPEDGWPEFGPDLVVEIVSPSDTARQIDRKMHQYLAAGTLAVWVVYPDTKSVHIFEPAGIARVVEIDGTLSSPQALPGFEIAVREIFRISTH